MDLTKVISSSQLTSPVLPSPLAGMSEEGRTEFLLLANSFRVLVFHLNQSSYFAKSFFCVNKIYYDFQWEQYLAHQIPPGACSTWE